MLQNKMLSLNILWIIGVFFFLIENTVNSVPCVIFLKGRKIVDAHWLEYIQSRAEKMNLAFN